MWESSEGPGTAQDPEAWLAPLTPTALPALVERFGTIFKDSLTELPACFKPDQFVMRARSNLDFRNELKPYETAVAAARILW